LLTKQVGGAKNVTVLLYIYLRQTLELKKSTLEQSD